MTGFRGKDDSGRVADPLTPETLRPLLWEASTWVVVELIGDTPAARARAVRAAAGRWRVEVRPVDDDPVAAEVPNTDAAFDVLRSWAADDGWYLEAFTWSPAGSLPA